MEVEILEGNPLPERLVLQWEGLCQENGFQNPFLTPLWSDIWLKHFGGTLAVKIFLLRSTGGVPLGLGVFSDSEKKKGHLSLLGSADVWDYRDFILPAGKEEEALGDWARVLAEGLWDGVELRGISEFSPTIRFLPAILRSLGLRVTEEVEEIAVYLNLPGTWDDFLKQMASKDRHELRRKMRRLEREASFEVLDGEGGGLSQKMDAFLELHRKSRRDKAEFMTPEMEAYFRSLAGRFQEKGWLTLPFLRVEGKEVAGYFSFRYREVEYVYNSGYDPEYRRLSPGIVLAGHCIRRAIEGGMRVFHFLRGQEEYKYRLGGLEEKIFRIGAIRP